MLFLRTATVLVAGSIAALLGPMVPAVAADYSVSPSMVHSWKPAGRVYDILTVGDRVYIGGTFSRVRNPVTGQWTPRERLAAFDRNTGELLPWNPGANDRVRALAGGPDGTVYVGGRFTSAAGVADASVVAVDAAGNGVPGFGALTSREVRDLAFTDGALFVAGNFKEVDGITRPGVARLDAATGELDTGFHARLRGGRAVALDVGPDGDLVIGGRFKTVDYNDQRFLARVAPSDGAFQADWRPPRVCDTCHVLDLVVPGDGRAYAALGGPGGGRAAAWDDIDGDRLWIKRGDGDVQAIDARDGQVYVGGHFGPGFDNETRSQFAALDSATGQLLPMAIDITGNAKPGIWAVDVDAQALRLGGGFRGVEGFNVARYAVFDVQP